jgi:hypothetical protein
MNYHQFFQKFRPIGASPIGLIAAWIWATSTCVAQEASMELTNGSSTTLATMVEAPVYRFQNGAWVLGRGQISMVASPPLSASGRLGGLPSLPNTNSATNPKKDLPPQALPTTRPIAPLPVAKPAGNKPGPAAPARSATPKVFPKIKIQGIYFRTNNPSIIINGETLFEGSWQGKIHVITITKTNVVLDLEGEQRVFKID